MYIPTYLPTYTYLCRCPCLGREIGSLYRVMCIHADLDVLVLIYILQVHSGRDRNAHGRITLHSALAWWWGGGWPEANDKAFLRYI